MKTACQFLESLNMLELSCDPIIPLLDIYIYMPKRIENLCMHKNLYINVHSSSTQIAKKVEAKKQGFH